MCAWRSLGRLATAWEGDHGSPPAGVAPVGSGWRSPHAREHVALLPRAQPWAAASSQGRDAVAQHTRHTLHTHRTQPTLHTHRTRRARRSTRSGCLRRRASRSRTATCSSSAARRARTRCASTSATRCSSSRSSTPRSPSSSPRSRRRLPTPQRSTLEVGAGLAGRPLSHAPRQGAMHWLRASRARGPGGGAPSRLGCRRGGAAATRQCSPRRR